MIKPISIHNKNFTAVSRHAPNARTMTVQQWGWWLAGLIDGHGHFNKLGYLVIAFDLNCVTTAYALKQRVGSGRVSRVKGKKALTYVLSHPAGRITVAHAVQDKLRHYSKIEQYNTRFAPKLNLPPTRPARALTKCDHWLAGFIQSNGLFQIKAYQRTNRPRLEFRAVLQIDQAERRLLDQMKQCFGGYVGYRANQEGYYYSSVSFHNAVALIHYLDVYQVHGHKMTAYKLWRQCNVLIQDAMHLTDAGCDKIMKRKLKLSKLLSSRV